MRPNLNNLGKQSPATLALARLVAFEEWEVTFFASAYEVTLEYKRVCCELREANFLSRPLKKRALEALWRANRQIASDRLERLEAIGFGGLDEKDLKLAPVKRSKGIKLRPRLRNFDPRRKFGQREAWRTRDQFIKDGVELSEEDELFLARLSLAEVAATHVLTPQLVPKKDKSTVFRRHGRGLVGRGTSARSALDFSAPFLLRSPSPDPSREGRGKQTVIPALELQ